VHVTATWMIALAVAGGCGPSGPAGPTGPDPVVVAPRVDAPTAIASPPPVDAAPVPPPLDRDMPALAAKLVELYRAAGDALATAGTDCGRASTGLVAVRDKFKHVRDATSRVVADGRAAQLEPELDRQREPIAAALARMQPTLDACRTDVRLNEALDGLAGGG
jgi:hypothetical protein